jgi:hypothetical protein
MKSHAEGRQERPIHLPASPSIASGEHGLSGFVDKRPETAQMVSLQQLANKSSEAVQLKALRDQMKNEPKIGDVASPVLQMVYKGKLLKGDRLHVAGENHGTSSKRRAEEERFVDDATEGGVYKTETEFEDSKGMPGDDPMLRFDQSLIRLAEVIEKGNISLERLGEREEECSSDYYVCKEVYEALNPDKLTDATTKMEAVDVIVKTIRSEGFQKLSEESRLPETKKFVDQILELAGNGKKKVQAARDRVMFLRSTAMNDMANKEKDVSGVWKVGGHHERHMKDLKKAYVLISREEFDQEYEAWAKENPQDDVPEKEEDTSDDGLEILETYVNNFKAEEEEEQPKLVPNRKRKSTVEVEPKREEIQKGKFVKQEPGGKKQKLKDKPERKQNKKKQVIKKIVKDGGGKKRT